MSSSEPVKVKAEAMDVDEGSAATAAAAAAAPAPATAAPADEEAEVARQRSALYSLVVQQLREDGHKEAAEAVAKATGSSEAPEADREKGKLLRVVSAQLGMEREEKAAAAAAAPSSSSAAAAAAAAAGARRAAGPAEVEPFPQYVQRFVTSHKGPCRVATFSPDGGLAATGSKDTTIKLVDMNRVRYYSRPNGGGGGGMSSRGGGGGDDATRPVIKTYYDHTGSVMDLAFHPTEPFLVSAARDCSIRFYNTTRLHAKRSARHVMDTHPLRSIDLHPAGDFMLAGTDHPMVRVYDVNTLKAFVSPDANRHHFGPVTCVKFGPRADVFASCSKDGSVKLWDTVTNRCVNTIRNAHSGAEVSSVRFSEDGRHLLTAGKDSFTRMWEISTGRQVDSFSGARHRQFHHAAVFDFSGDYIMAPDESSSHVVVWSVQSTELVRKLSGHTAMVRHIAVSPVDGSLVTCSDDMRARFWAVDK